MPPKLLPYNSSVGKSGSSSLYASLPEKKGHICPPSTATHPRDRWETAFVYAFIGKFSDIKPKIEGLYSPMDLEDALLTPVGQPNRTLEQVLNRLILFLRPRGKDLPPSQLNAGIQTILADAMRPPERSVFWDDQLKANVDPITNVEGGFWGVDWNIKLQILRQLVEHVLCNSQQVREILDRAWGIKHMQHKKKEGETAPPDADDPMSQEHLIMQPIGTDKTKVRYWVVDESPRLYISTNPWKMSSSFTAISSTQEEYMKAIEELRATAPPGDVTSEEKRSKMEMAHLRLITVLESRIPAIEAELNRIQRMRKKIEQKNLQLVQSQVRGVRTRRQTRRPDYVYNDGVSEDDDRDEYRFEEDEEMDVDNGFDYDEDGWDSAAGANGGRRLRNGHARGNDEGRRRSLRQTNGKRKSTDPDEQTEWRGERRSRRLGNTTDDPMDEGPPRKPSRTEESSEGGGASSVQNSGGEGQSSHSFEKTKLRATGAAALKPTETAVEALNGKKGGKYWFYAVEPAVESTIPQVRDEAAEGSTLKPPSHRTNGHPKRIESTEPSESRHTTVERGESSAAMSMDSGRSDRE
ncbi:hypothetical protein SISSUDRAFT_1039618 [Sistotremastrum suecicum HHB10207 ss-3]|uniref:WHIM1 domain-containing protein n=1 Tax=Sistotremastrum suecicum HHB10207 ss-3 TaxID=1314776 RepID=A0A166IHA3_9AGAM|nr:hypothetical protein SISSUDRAFT_1039618 [Sistotremastrum suecicum HHB10207 ss-3]